MLSIDMINNSMSEHIGIVFVLVDDEFIYIICLIKFVQMTIMLKLYI